MIRARVKWLRRIASRRTAGSPSVIRARRRNTVVVLGRSGLVAATTAGIVGFLVLLLGPVAHWATIDADYHAAQGGTRIGCRPSDQTKIGPLT
jgi:hypothetical protein